jgi:hypothetical protein
MRNQSPQPLLGSSRDLRGTPQRKRRVSTGNAARTGVVVHKWVDWVDWTNWAIGISSRRGETE